jgi:hypothetical protein
MKQCEKGSLRQSGKGCFGGRRRWRREGSLFKSPLFRQRIVGRRVFQLRLAKQRVVRQRLFQRVVFDGEDD